VFEEFFSNQSVIAERRLASSLMLNLYSPVISSISCSFSVSKSTSRLAILDSYLELKQHIDFLENASHFRRHEQTLQCLSYEFFHDLECLGCHQVQSDDLALVQNH
jgi:hypothetical protein